MKLLGKNKKKQEEEIDKTKLQNTHTHNYTNQPTKTKRSKQNTQKNTLTYSQKIGTRRMKEGETMKTRFSDETINFKKKLVFDERTHKHTRKISISKQFSGEIRGRRTVEKMMKYTETHTHRKTTTTCRKTSE